MKIELEINAPTPEEFGELIFTLLHTAYGVDPDTCKLEWNALADSHREFEKTGSDSAQFDLNNDLVYSNYLQVGTTIRDMQLAYYKAGVEAGVQAAQIGGPIESQN